MFSRHRNADIRYVGAVAFQQRLDVVRDTAHSVTIGGIVAHNDLQLIRHGSCAERCQRRGGDETIHDVIHPAGRQTGIMSDAGDAQLPRRILTYAQLRRCAELRAGIVKRGFLDADFPAARRPAPTFGGNRADITCGKILKREQLGGKARTVHFYRCRRMTAHARRGDGGQCSHLRQQCDDGVGADLGAIEHGAGTGLRRLRERLRWLYGDRARLDVISAPGGGFAAELSVPQGVEDIADFAERP